VSARAREGRTTRADLVLALLVLAIIAMMIVPLPTPLIDLLIALNLALGVLVVSAALYMRDALSFAAFPTVLLLSTLFRLALNVSSTRLILLQADAGRVIEAFGSFVVRGDYRVGALVFVMLTLIQFIVIARGAERVAEVAARFSLDALPGRQLTIDAEVRAGTLRPDAARVQRERLSRESQLYGALDGALKFVKGDAIAGIVITAINLVGGVALGVFARDLTLEASLATYGLLTIGDGLVTQIPALLGATAAGLVVTRVSGSDREASLASDLATQLFGDSRALAVGALVSTFLALVPGLPAWPFALLGLACAAAAVLAARRERQRSSERDDALHTAPLTLELGSALYASLATRKHGRRELAQTIAHIRQGLREDLGVPLPALSVRPSTTLPGLSFRFLWRDLPAPSHAIDARESALPAIERALSELARKRAAEWLDLDEVQRMLDQLEREQPNLVRLSVPSPLSAVQLTQVLRQLVGEGVTVRWLGEIIDAIAPHIRVGTAPHELVEQARRALAPRITHSLAPEGQLHLLRLAPEVEEALSDGLRELEGEQVLALVPELKREIADAIAAAHANAPIPHALVTLAPLRRHVRALLSEQAPRLPIVSAYELMPHLTVTSGEPIGP
jgi:type III secretion protein V